MAPLGVTTERNGMPRNDAVLVDEINSDADVAFSGGSESSHSELVCSIGENEGPPFTGGPMKRSKFSDEQILAIVKEGEAGRKVADLCRAYGFTEQTYYRWKA